MLLTAKLTMSTFIRSNTENMALSGRAETEMTQREKDSDEEMDVLLFCTREYRKRLAIHILLC